MPLSIPYREPQSDAISSGLAGAIALHVLIAAALIGAAFYAPSHHPWGENASTEGAIQASMVSAIPLPRKAAPVDKSMLTSENVSDAPKPPPKEEAATPPKPTDVLVKGKTVTKTAPVATPEPPKHPQPTPTTAPNKATTGDAATMIPQAVAQLKNGTASLTVQNRAFGDRYAYYLRGVSNTIGQNWFTQEADPRASQGKHVKLIFDINRDGTPTNIRVETPSGSASLDASALHALQRVEGFGPLPAGNSITIEDTFDYHQP